MSYIKNYTKSLDKENRSKRKAFDRANSVWIQKRIWKGYRRDAIRVLKALCEKSMDTVMMFIFVSFILGRLG